jgi:hypothetical protein
MFEVVLTQISESLRSLILRQVQLIRKRPCTHKTVVILALCSRATRLNEALIILSHSGFRDEAAALLRVLIEVVVNGAYLMVTEDKEFNAFVAHPMVMLGKHHRSYLAQWGDQTSFTEDFNELVASGAAEAAAISNRTEKDSSWTSEGVRKRADLADSQFKHSDFSYLATTAYVEGNNFIHGNFSSLIEIIGEFQGETPSREEIRVHEDSKLSGATWALWDYAMALDQHFTTNLSMELKQILSSFPNVEGSAPDKHH